MKKLILLIMAVILIAACSPPMQPVSSVSSEAIMLNSKPAKSQNWSANEEMTDAGLHVCIEDTVTIIKYTGESKDVVIPSKIHGKPVTAIADSAFAFCSLTAVALPDSVTTIGNEAFTWNKLTTLEIPDSVTSIGKNAFSANQISSLRLPETLTTISSSAFASNFLSSITIPDAVTAIEEYAFFQNQITNLVIPNSVMSIGKEAFAYNWLNEIPPLNNAVIVHQQAFENQSKEPDSENQFKTGQYIDGALIDWIGVEKFESWLDEHAQYTVYDLLDDFQITNEQLKTIVVDYVYEEYMRYRPANQ